MTRSGGRLIADGRMERRKKSGRVTPVYIGGCREGKEGELKKELSEGLEELLKELKGELNKEIEEGIEGILAEPEFPRGFTLCLINF